MSDYTPEIAIPNPSIDQFLLAHGWDGSAGGAESTVALPGHRANSHQIILAQRCQKHRTGVTQRPPLSTSHTSVGRAFRAVEAAFVEVSLAVCDASTALRKGTLPLSKSVSVEIPGAYLSAWFLDAHLCALVVLQVFSWFVAPAFLKLVMGLGGLRGPKPQQRAEIGSSKEKAE